MPQAYVNGIPLYYEDVGDGAPLLFIHGASADASRWAGQITRLSPYFRCVAYDRRGSSRSPLGAGTRPEPRIHADDAAGLIQHLGLGPCILVATSQGGHVGLDLMLRYPELLRGALLNEPGVPSLDAEGAARFASDVRWVVDLAYVDGGPRAVVDAYMTYSDPAGWAVTSEADRNRLRDNHDGLFQALATTLPDILPQDLATVAMPCVVVVGTETHDFFRRVSERVAAGIPGARLVEIEGAGHHTYMRKPAEFAEIVRGFAGSMYEPAAESVPPLTMY
jgi:pimeloyl-ACP methyl ester carboxylesterase